MEYEALNAGTSQYTIDASLSTPSITISGSFGGTTDTSSLSGLVVPSHSSTQFTSTSGLSPMTLFETQVCHQWTSKFEPEERLAFTTTFQEMSSSGTACLTGYSCDTLRHMWKQGKIRWGEAEIQEEKLRNMTLPLDPGFDLSAPFSGPPIFVRQPDDGDKIAIMNGNHRTAKVILEGAAINASIYVLELSSPEASEQLLGVKPVAKYTQPHMPSWNDCNFRSDTR